MGIKSMVLESDCLCLNPAFLTCYCGLWISKVTLVYSTCLFFFFAQSLHARYCLRYQRFSQDQKRQKPLFVWSLDDPVFR